MLKNGMFNARFLFSLIIQCLVLIGFCLAGAALVIIGPMVFLVWLVIAMALGCQVVLRMRGRTQGTDLAARIRQAGRVAGFTDALKNGLQAVMDSRAFLTWAVIVMLMGALVIALAPVFLTAALLMVAIALTTFLVMVIVMAFLSLGRPPLR